MKHLFIFGTRPEAIKLAPLIKVFKKETSFDVSVCVTGQHREMLDQVLEFFDIIPDYDLDLMAADQTLFDVTARALVGLKAVLDEFKPDNIFVQGDTTSAFVGALAGFYEKIKVSHIEAGLRSGDKYSPFPEEGNRILAGHLSTYHFSPTQKAVDNLHGEGIKNNIHLVGNTVIDALLLGLEIIKDKGEQKYLDFFSQVDFTKKVILVTGHRRESFGRPFENMCEAIKEIAEKYDDVEIVYPVHLNPNVRITVNKILEGVANVKLIEPLSYPYLIWLMSQSYLVLTDSGGIQEEAPSLGKPVLVMREVTERREGIEAGTALLVGTHKDKIIKEAEKLIMDDNHYKKMANAVNPYGDGTTSERVLEIFKIFNSKMKKALDIKAVMIGMGYIGLPTAALMASKGIRVHGVDVNEKAVATINKGEIHIVEPDLEGLVHHVVKNGFLSADVKPAQGDVFLIAVPTPFKGDHQPDISFVETAAQNIASFLVAGNLVILESTSPVGTTERVKEIIDKERPEIKGKYFIAYCPERVLPGNIIHELEYNDRSIGGIDTESTEKAIEFYSHFVKGELHATNSRTAEMCKLVENSYRDVNIAFANELSMICDEAGIDVWELINLANKHPRVNILQPGTGVGGHCIAVDPWFIVSEFPEQAKMIRTAREVNNYKTEWVIEKIKNVALQFELENGRKPKIACLGLAFKPNIDDLRESPALEVVKSLINQGLIIMAVEPNISIYQDISILSLEKAMKCADLMVKLVNHSNFSRIEKSFKSQFLNFC